MKRKKVKSTIKTSNDCYPASTNADAGDFSLSRRKSHTPHDRFERRRETGVQTPSSRVHPSIPFHTQRRTDNWLYHQLLVNKYRKISKWIWEKKKKWCTNFKWNCFVLNVKINFELHNIICNTRRYHDLSGRNDERLFTWFESGLSVNERDRLASGRCRAISASMRIRLPQWPDEKTKKKKTLNKIPSWNNVQHRGAVVVKK